MNLVKKINSPKYSMLESIFKVFHFHVKSAHWNINIQMNFAYKAVTMENYTVRPVVLIFFKYYLGGA